MAGPKNPGYPNVVAARSAVDDAPTDILMDPASFALYTGTWVWNASTLIWEKMTQPKTTDNAEAYGYNGTNWHEVRIDSTTRSISTVTYPHSEAHGGRAYLTVYSATADDTDFIEVRIQSADTTRLSHMTIHIESALAATAQFWKDTTKTDVVGNRLGALNRRFDSENVSGMTNCHTPGGSNTGAAGLIKYIGSTTVSGRTEVGGGAQSRGEFILDQNSAHDILLTSRADSNALSIELDWYEHTDKPV